MSALSDTIDQLNKGEKVDLFLYFILPTTLALLFAIGYFL